MCLVLASIANGPRCVRRTARTRPRCIFKRHHPPNKTSAIAADRAIHRAADAKALRPCGRSAGFRFCLPRHT